MSVNDRINATIYVKEYHQHKAVMESTLLPRAESTLHKVLLDRAKKNCRRTTVQIDCDTTESLTCPEQDLMWKIIGERTGMYVHTRETNWMLSDTRIAGDKVLPTVNEPRKTYEFNVKETVKTTQELYGDFP